MYSKEGSFLILYEEEEKTMKQRRRGMVIFPDVLLCLGAFVL